MPTLAAAVARFIADSATLNSERRPFAIPRKPRSETISFKAPMSEIHNERHSTLLIIIKSEQFYAKKIKITALRRNI